MADPRPVVRATGIVRAAELFDLTANQETGEVRTAGRLNVLTDDGGFLDVYVPPEIVKNTQFEKNDTFDAPVEIGIRYTQRRAGGWNSELQATLREAPRPSAA